MPRLIACPSCSVHVRRGGTTCPHCGATIRDATVVRTAGAVLMGLTLAGCPGDEDPSPTSAGEPEYGVPATESNSGEPTDESGTDDTGGSTDTGAETGETISVGEPEYGVPETDSVGEPDYGVPETSGA
jgi:hypothetical protein